VTFAALVKDGHGFIGGSKLDLKKILKEACKEYGKKFDKLKFQKLPL
jgi:hypothetical protein